MNEFYLVGRIENDLSLFNESDKLDVLMISTTRPYKDVNGEYVKDIIPIKISTLISQKVIDFCRKNDTLGIRGFIRCDNNTIELVADKISFLRSDN